MPFHFSYLLRRNGAPRFRVACGWSLGVVCLMASGAVCPVGYAQQAATGEVRAATDVFLQELNRQSRGTPQQLGRAIRTALRLGMTLEASGYLETLATRQLNDQQAAELVAAVGGETLVAAATNGEISDVAKAQIQAVFEGKSRFDRGDGRLQEAVEAIGVGSPDQQLAAMRALLSAGRDAIGPLTLAAVVETDADRRDELLSVLVQLGPESLAAMSAVAMYGPESMRLGGLQSLQRLKPDSARPLMAVAAITPSMGVDLQAFARAELESRLGAVPTAREVEDYLVDRIQSLRDRFQRIDSGGQQRTVWRVDGQTGALDYMLADAGVAAQRELADTARLVSQLDGVSSAGWRAAVQADLGYRYLADPLAFSSPTDGLELRRALEQMWGEGISEPAILSDLIAAAMDQGDYPALIAALSLVDDQLTGAVGALLTSRSAAESPLIRAVDHAVPQVRYEAALAVARLLLADPEAARGGFAGISCVGRRFEEILRLHPQPTVLIVDTRTARQTHVESLFSAIGFRADVVTSVAAMERRLVEAGDIQCIVTSSELPDRTVLELVDRVRRLPIGRLIPILIHGPMDASVSAAIHDVRWELTPVHFEMPESVVGLGAILGPQKEQLEQRLQGIKPLTSDQRYDFRRRASFAITGLARSPEMYEFCGLGQVSAGLIGEASRGMAPAGGD